MGRLLIFFKYLCQAFPKYGLRILKIFFSALKKRPLGSFIYSVQLAEYEDVDAFIIHFGYVANKLKYLKFLQPYANVAVFFHGIDMSAYLKKYGSNIYHDIFNTADILLPISNHWKEKLIQLGAPEKKLNILHMGIDIKKHVYQARSLNMQNPVRFLTIGRLVTKKGYDDSLKALSLLKQYYRFSYTIIGSGPMEPVINRLIKDYQLDRHVNMLGSIPNDQIGKYYDNTDIFILPSKTDPHTGDKEGIPVVLMESMARGIPVISSNHSGIPELITDNETGWLVPESDPVALYEKIKYVLSNWENAQKCAKAARHFIKCHFNTENLNHKLESVLQN